MKMKWFDRVLLFLVLLFVITLSLLLIGIVVGPLKAPFESFYALMTNGLLINTVLVIVACCVVILLIIRLFVATTGGSSKQSFAAPASVLVKTTDDGAIHIAISAVDAMVQRAARAVPSVREVLSRVSVNEQESLLVTLGVAFAPDTIVQEATVQLQNDVKSYLEAHLGVPVATVQVYVEQVGVKQTSARVD